MGVNRIKDIRIRDPYIYCNVEGYCFIFDIRTGLFDDSHLSWNKALRKWGFSGQGTKRLKTADGVEWAVDSLGVRMSYRKPCYATWLLRQPGCQVRALFRDREGRIWVCSRYDASVRIYDANPVGCVHDVARRGRQPMVGMQTWWTVASVAPCRRQLRHQPNSACNPW